MKMKEGLHPADFTIREDGVVRLNPDLARQLRASLCPDRPDRVRFFGRVQ